jgi:hypothetical protein
MRPIYVLTTCGLADFLTYLHLQIHMIDGARRAVRCRFVSRVISATARSHHMLLKVGPLTINKSNDRRGDASCHDILVIGVGSPAIGGAMKFSPTSGSAPMGGRIGRRGGGHLRQGGHYVDRLTSARVSRTGWYSGRDSQSGYRDGSCLRQQRR